MVNASNTSSKINKTHLDALDNYVCQSISLIRNATDKSRLEELRKCLHEIKANFTNGTISKENGIDVLLEIKEILKRQHLKEAEMMIDIHPTYPTIIDPKAMCLRKLKNKKINYAVILQKIFGQHGMRLERKKYPGDTSNYRPVIENSTVHEKIMLHMMSGCGCARLKFECRNIEENVSFVTYLCNLKLIGEKIVIFSGEKFKPSIMLNESCFSGIISNKSIILNKYQIQLNDEVSSSDLAKRDDGGWKEFQSSNALKLKFMKRNCPIQLPIAMNMIPVGYLIHYPNNTQHSIDVCRIVNELPREECYRKFVKKIFKLERLFDGCKSMGWLKNKLFTVKNIMYNNLTYHKNGAPIQVPLQASVNITLHDNITIAPLRKGNQLEISLWNNDKIKMRLTIEFTSQECSNKGDYTGCENSNAVRECNQMQLNNQTLFNNCVSCLKNYISGEIDKCGRCYTNSMEKDKKSKCVCMKDKFCYECPSDKLNGKCVPCQRPLILGCDRKCVEPSKRGKCLTVIQNNCLLNANRRGTCQILSQSSNCSLSEVSKESLRKGPKGCVSLQYGYNISSDCQSGKYNIVCQVNNKEEKITDFQYSKQEPLNISLVDNDVGYYSFQHLKVICKNSNRCGNLKVTVGSKSYHLTSAGNNIFSSRNKIKYLPNKKYNFTVMDCCGNKINLKPNITCFKPEVVNIKGFKEGFVVSFKNEINLLDKAECKIGRKRGNRKLVVKTLNLFTFGDCIRSKCQSQNDVNSFTSMSIPSFLTPKESCKELFAKFPFKANFTCGQNGGSVFKFEGSFISIKFSDIDMSKIVSCRAESTENIVYSSTFTYDPQYKKLSDKCLQIKIKCNKNRQACKFFVMGKREVRWIIKELDIAEIGTELPFHKLKSFDEDKTYSIEAQLPDDSSVNSTLNNIPIPKYEFSVEAKAENIIIECSKNIQARKMFKPVIEKGLKVISENYNFQVGDDFYDQQVFNSSDSCDSVVTLNGNFQIQHKDGGISTEVTKTIEIQYTSLKCPKIYINPNLPVTGNCMKRFKVKAANVEDFASNVSLSLEDDDGYTINIHGVCQEINNKPLERICCFNDSILDTPLTYQFSAIIGSSDILCGEVSDTVDIVVEEDLKVEILCPDDNFTELEDMELLINADNGENIISTCEQVNINVATFNVITMKLLRDIPIICTIQNNAGTKEIKVNVPQQCLDKIQPKLSKMNSTQLAEFCDKYNDFPPEKVECKNLLSYYRRKIKPQSSRRKRRSIVASCEAELVETCYNDLIDAKNLVEARREDDMPNLIKPSICNKRCKHQSPCSIAFEIINLYFHQRKDDNELFSTDESDFFHCGFSSVIYPVEDNEHMNNAIGNFTTFIVDIQKTLVVSSIGLDQPKHIEADFIGTKTWLYEGSSGPSSFSWNESALVLNEMFQSTYDNWECSVLNNCTTIFISMTQMKLYHDASTNSYKDALTIGAISQTGINPITDIYIVNFFSPVDDYDVIDLDDPSHYYVINMTVYQKNPNATIKCYYFNVALSEWKVTPYNAQMYGETISCACNKTGPCAAFEVSDIFSVLPIQTPIETTTQSVPTTSPSVPTTSNATQATVDTTPSQTVEISFDVDYDKTCSKYNSTNACSADICNKTRKKIDVPAENFKNCEIMEGSIIVQFVVTDSSQGNLNATLDSIKSLVKNETFVITLADGTTLAADKDSYKEGNDVTSTQQPPTKDDDDDDNRMVIFVVVAIILGIGLVIVFVVIYIICTKDKKKVIPTPEASATSLRDMSTEK